MNRILILSDEARAEITRRYKSEKNSRFRERLHCLLLKDQGYTNTQVTQMLLEFVEKPRTRPLSFVRRGEKGK